MNEAYIGNSIRHEDSIPGEVGDEFSVGSS